MADGIIQVPPDSTGKKVDAASMDVGANTVMRQRMVIGDNSATAQFATVTGGALLVTGTVSLGAGTANIGTVNNISATVVVAGIVSLGAGTALIGAVSLAAGTANIGFINNISATVTVAGTVSLGAGTANIGSINNISATVIVAGEIANGASLSTTNKPILMGGNTSAGGAGGLMATLLVDTSGRIILGASTNNIGAISNAAGTALMGAVSLAAGTANIGFINNISATVVVSGTVSLGAGTANIGTINNVSATVVVAGAVSLAAGTANIGFINNISATVVTGLSYVIEKTTNSQVQVGDSLNAAVRVNVVAGSAGSPSNVDNTTYSTGVTNVVPSGFIFFSASATAMLDGRVGAGRMTEFRAQHVNLRHADGTEIDLSSTPSVILVTGTANIGSLNNISATVVVAGAVSLAAGTANIGFLNGISATVVTGLSYVIEKTTNSQVQVGDSLNAAIRVNVVAGSSGGPSNTDNTTYSTGVTTVAGAGFIHFSASAVAMTDGRIGAARITSQRGVHVNLRTDTGTAMDDVTNNALRVNVVAGGAAGGTSLADGSPFTPQTTAFTPIGGEVDDVAPNVLAEGSAGAVRVTPNRAFHVNLRDSAGAELGTTASPLSVKVERQSATVTVALVAGAANIGFINNISATVLVAGVVSLGAGAANIGFINNISATVLVAGVVSLGAGAANIGFINNISATVIVAGEIANGASLSTTNKPVLMGGNTSAGGAGGLMVTLLLDTSGRPILGAGTNNIGAVSLAAGTANIGFINNISATVLVAGVVSLGAGAANIGFINNISATVLVAGVVSLGAGAANIGFINNISATVIVAGVVSIGAGTNLMGAVSLAAGTANIGFINNISATVTTVVNGFTPAIMSASHGPKCVTASTSANVTLIASPGAGLFVYITQIACSNAGAVGSRHRIGTSASIATIVMFCASAGGGFVMNFDPPWKLSASEAALCSVKPNTSKGLFNVNFFVAA